MLEAQCPYKVWRVCLIIKVQAISGSFKPNLSSSSVRACCANSAAVGALEQILLGFLALRGSGRQQALRPFADRS